MESDPNFELRINQIAEDAKDAYQKAVDKIIEGASVPEPNRLYVEWMMIAGMKKAVVEIINEYNKRYDKWEATCNQTTE